MCRLICLLTCLTLTLHTWGALTFRVEKDFPSVGLHLKLPSGGEPEPIAQPRTYSYTFTTDDESVKRDLYDPKELWYATQHAGQWRDASDNRMILGHVTRKLPDLPALAGTHVDHAAFTAAIEADESAIDPDDDDQVRDWIIRFTGRTPKPFQTVKAPFKLAEVRFYPLSDTSTLIYLFRLKGHSGGGAASASDWFCVVLAIADNTPPDKVRTEFETRFLPAVAPISRAATINAKRNTKELKAFTPGSRKPVAIAEHPSRETAKKSIANMDGWWFAETPDYIFLSDVRNALGKKLVQNLQNTMPAYRKALAKLIPPYSESEEVHVVRIFENADDYKRHVGESHEWSSGLWDPNHRELVILAGGKDAADTMEIIRHEGFHQYLFYASDLIPNAMWYNEGHACFCEGVKIDNRGKVTFGESPNRAAHVDRELERVVKAIPDVLKADYNTFYAKSKDRLLLNYSTAWAVIYFLEKGAPGNRRTTAYTAILPTYRKVLRETKNPKLATEAAFEGIEMADFQAAFSDFWKRGRNNARRYDPLTAPKRTGK
ncbi:MAG: hypothetical protein J6334_10955 [Kiritimatiellae bacterium]|nr:hypothetical protein [Kiritimatiellia bacterium]